MERTEMQNVPSLQDALTRISSAVGDWWETPLTDVNQRGAFEDYPLHKVAIWGDAILAEVLIANGADVNSTGEDADTPLHRAVMGRHADMVRCLISHGADPTLKDRYGWTALDAAKASGASALVEAMAR